MLRRAMGPWIVVAGLAAAGAAPARAADLDGFGPEGPPARWGGPGPVVVYDERAPGRRFGPAWDEDDGATPPRPPRPAYRAAGYGPGFAPEFGAPEVECTVERSQSITPAGWRKTVTRRTCYQR